MFADIEGQSGMKLVKAVCMMCWNRHAETQGNAVGWSSWDEDNWVNKRKVFCPMDDGEDRSESLLCGIDEIPELCPYRVEHLVSQ